MSRTSPCQKIRLSRPGLVMIRIATTEPASCMVLCCHKAFRKTLLRIATLIFMLLVLGLSGCAPTSDNKSTPVLSSQPNTTYPMPPLAGPRSFSQLGWVLSDKQRVTIGSYQDKVLVLDFYATWCQPCRESVPLLLDLRKRYGPKGLSVVGLNVGGPGDLDAVPKFVEELKIDYPLGVPDQALTDLLMSDSDAIPQTFVFDRQGHLIRRYVGVFDASDIDDLIKSALQTESHL